jgi:hypothetical protein
MEADVAKNKLPWALVLNVSDLSDDRIAELWERAEKQGLRQVVFPPMGIEDMSDPGTWLVNNEYMFKEIWLVQQPDDKLIDCSTEDGQIKITRHRKIAIIQKIAKRLRISVKKLSFKD